MRIFLIGFMGSGKSYLGNIWAENNGLSFYDIDNLIEQEEQLSIKDIFEIKGEAYFRKKEAEVLKNMSENDNCIIICGGGTPCYFDNLQWMKANGIVVFLNPTESDILKNIHTQPLITRPLIDKKNSKEVAIFISEKLQERMPYYIQSHITLPSSLLNKNGFETIKDFIKKLSV